MTFSRNLPYSIGTIVRAPLPTSSIPLYNLSTIATIEHNENNNSNTTVTILFDSLLPSPRAGVSFIIIPTIYHNNNEEEECIINTSKLLLPLSFERSTCPLTPQQYKNNADQLFTLHDATSAASYYDACLYNINSDIKLGSLIIINYTNHIYLAEVDSIGDSLDVTITTSNESLTIMKKDVILCLNNDLDHKLLIGVFLNLTRCLLSLVDTINSKLFKKYARCAVLCSTVALVCDQYYHTDYSTKARLLRARANIKLGYNRWKVVKKDLNQLIVENPENKDAKKLLSGLEERQRKKKIMEKKLCKDICKWLSEVNNRKDDKYSREIEEKKDRIKQKNSNIQM